MITHRSIARIKSTGEIFTPSTLVDTIIDNIESDLFLSTHLLFLDPACGDGEFLRGVVRKIRVTRSSFSKRSFFHVIKKQILGVDLMWDNVCDTVYYLLRSYEPVTDLTIEQSGFENIANSEEVVNEIPEEINKRFVGVRKYKDSKGIIELRRHNESNHFVEYRLNERGKWIPVENIVRANSLIEWDSKNWQCRCCKIS